MSRPIPIRHVLLWGPPGAGKSTLAPLLAARLGIAHTDLDAVIETRVGCSVAQLWAQAGEGAFRSCERAELDRLLLQAAPQVIALGGGALLDRDFRRSVLEDHIVLGLRTTDAELQRRLTLHVDHTRPALAGDPKTSLSKLLQDRCDAYAECHAFAGTDADPSEVCEALLRALDLADMVVPLGARSYPVSISQGELEASLGVWLQAERARFGLWLVDEGAYAHHWPRIDALAALTGAPRLVLPGGESCKSLAAAEIVWGALSRAGVDRSMHVGIVGGGALMDMASFAASCWHRGTPHILVPTTLLGMVDAGIGGKTALNAGFGKNLIGTLWQPRAVFADRTLLAGNTSAKSNSDQAELLKVAALADADLASTLQRDSLPDRSAIRRALRVKTRLVSSDEHDIGDRALLNFGHTVGHALERVSGYALAHGDAVARGMRWELAALMRLGLCAPSERDAMNRWLDALGFVDDSQALPEQVLALLAEDKKVAHGKLRLTTLRFFGDAVVVRVPVLDFVGALRACQRAF